MLLTLLINQRNWAAPALVDLAAASCVIDAKKRSFAVSIKDYRKLAYAPAFVCLNVFS